MSILKRPGWANSEIINEGRLHNDKLKERIGRMFDRLSLGYSPNHVIDKIAGYIKSKNGEKIDINKLSDDYIINVANSDFITKGRFTPSLKPSFASEYQNTNLNTDTQQPSNEPVTIDFSIDTQQNTNSTPSIPVGTVPSEDAESYGNKEDEENFEKENPQDNNSPVSKQKIEEYLSGISDEDLEKHRSAWKSNTNKDEFDTLNLIHQEIERRKNNKTESSEELDYKKADLDKDGKISEYERKRGQAIQNSMEKNEDAEEVESFDSNTADSEFSSEIQKQNQHRVKHPNYLKDKKVNHESVKLSPQAVNKLLKENYSKKKQHEFRIEQRYYGM